MTSIYHTIGTFHTFRDMVKLIKVISFKYLKMENFSPINNTGRVPITERFLSIFFFYSFFSFF